MWRLLALLVTGLATWPADTWATHRDLGHAMGLVLGPLWVVVAYLAAFRARPSISALLALVVATGWVRALTYEPFRDPECRDSCVVNPLMVTYAPTVADACVYLGIAASAVVWACAMISQPSLGGALLGSISLAAAVVSWGSRPEAAPASAAGLHLAAGVLVLLLLLRSITRRLWLTRRLMAVGAAMTAGTAVPAATLLGGALRDPRLRVAYAGASAPAPGPRRRQTQLIDRASMIAVIDHDASVSVDVLKTCLGPTVRTAIYNEALESQLEAHVRSLAESRRRLVDQLDAERTRLERDLHDGAQRGILGLAMDFHAERLRAESAGDDRRANEAGKAEETMTVLLGRLREVARGVHPAVLDGGGLLPALRDLTDNVPCLLTVDGPVDAPPRVARAVFALAREATLGAIDELALSGGDGLLLTVTTSEPPTESVRDRVAVADGTLILTGTGWEARLPCE